MTGVLGELHGPWPYIQSFQCYSEYHNCHFCGEWVRGGWQSDGQRHYLSDCRPDLVEHEIGPNCTWGKAFPNGHGHTCYAYQNHDTFEWTDQHIHFYSDGPM